MDLICSNSKDVLTRPDTLSVSRLFMQAILDEDHLPVREVVLYKITMCWGIRQFKNQNGGEDPTDLELREVLGDLLYKIRFPAMLPKEFSEISTGSDLLTAAEKESIYCYLVTKKQLDQLQFSVNKRVNTEMFVDRTELCSSTHWFFDPYFFLDAITFTTSADIVLTGIGLYTAVNKNGYTVDLEISQSVKRLMNETIVIPHTGNSTPHKVILDKPLQIVAGLLYSIRAKAHGRIRYAGTTCTAKCTTGNITFKFHMHSRVGNYITDSGSNTKTFFRKSALPLQREIP